MSIRRTPKVIQLQETTQSELARATSRYSDAKISEHSVFVAFVGGVQKYRYADDETWRKLPIVIDFERTKRLASAVEEFADFFMKFDTVIIELKPRDNYAHRLCRGDINNEWHKLRFNIFSMPVCRCRENNDELSLVRTCGDLVCRLRVYSTTVWFAQSDVSPVGKKDLILLNSSTFLQFENNSQRLCRKKIVDLVVALHKLDTPDLIIFMINEYMFPAQFVTRMKRMSWISAAKKSICNILLLREDKKRKI